MANPRRNSFSISHSLENQNLSSSLSLVLHFLKKPQAFPILLSIFVLLTWLSLRLQRSAQFSSPSNHPHDAQQKWSHDEDDDKANLVRFKSAIPSLIRKDNRGWLLNPVSLAIDSRIQGGAISCVSVHLGEIRPGGMRGNHRHHTCNETFVIWGAKTKFRLENNQVDKGFAEVIVGEDEVALAASSSGTAHALVNVDPVHSTFFMGCQDSVVNYSSSTTDFNVWKDL
ncbi:uncharacterized protein LOC110817144 [Carica papaya]|uniref:uncharacterized protein LOC110817144 n=1 Tax=Carica papaya TaxID=3649 RepID=UPI000B8CEFFD|nr:uncharacterized protein LOC110817144 [Carica papaya]